MTSRERIALAFTMRVLAYREGMGMAEAVEAAATAWNRLQSHLEGYR